VSAPDDAFHPHRHRRLPHVQRYPVIFLTFKSIKHGSYEACWKAIKATIELLSDEHRGVFDAAGESSLATPGDSV
jgi:hypothetical protein